MSPDMVTVFNPLVRISAGNDEEVEMGEEDATSSIPVSASC